jgi:hypothetical protein
MAARINREMFSNAGHTPGPQAPRPEPRDERAESSPPPPASAPAPQAGSIPPMLAALISSIPPFSSRSSSRPPAAVASSPPVAARPADDATAADKPLTARTLRIGSIRVAITGSLEEKKFSVERLERGEPVPTGAMEAMLVLTGEVEGSLSMETHLPVANRSAAKP